MSLGNSDCSSTILHHFEKMTYKCETSDENFVASFETILSSVTNIHPLLLVEETKIQKFTSSSFDFKVKFVSLLNIGDGWSIKNDVPNRELNYVTLNEAARHDKLITFVKENAHQLCLAESIATEVPIWQIEQYELPLWKEQLLYKDPPILPLRHLKSYVPVVIVLPFGSQHGGLSITQRLLGILQFTQKADRVVILTSALEPCYLPALIPTFHLIREINKAKIWTTPIELHITETLCLKDIERHNELFWNTYILTPEALNSATISLYSGVFSSSGGEGPCVQYIIDSSADLVSAVDSISSNMWESGSKALRRRLSLLLVQESVHGQVLNLFRKFLTKITELNITESADNSSYYKVLDSPRARIVYDIGPASPYFRDSARSKKTTLFFLPYRNSSELLALVNNFGGMDKSIGFFTNCPSTISQLTASVQILGGIWVNTTPRQCIPDSLYNFGVVDFLREETEEPENTTPFNADVWKRIASMGENGSKIWSKEVDLEERVEKILNACQNCLSFAFVREKEILELIIQSEKITKTEENLTGSLVAFNRQLYGIVGIVIFGDSVPFEEVGITIIQALLKGNAVTVVLARSQQFSEILMEFASFFPVGVVQCTIVKDVGEGMTGLAQEGKVRFVWAIHNASSDEDLQLTTCNIPKDAFTKIWVKVSQVESTGRRNEHNFEIKTPVYF